MKTHINRHNDLYYSKEDENLGTIKEGALSHLWAAHDSLDKAKNAIAFVAGPGMAEIYADIVDVSHDVMLPLIHKLKSAKPAGIDK